MKTLFRTNIRGNYEGETVVDLGVDDTDTKRQLRVCTHKTASRRLVTQATVVQPTEYGFSFVVFQDFSKVVLNTSPKRITKKIVEEQHTQALEHIEELVLAAQMHHNIMPELA